MATILGTLQSCLTYFPYLRKEWRENCEEERLLGVSLTGIYDNPLTYGRDGLGRLAHRLETLRDLARFVNGQWADKLGIPRSAAITCVKPSGTVSCLCDSASGIHPRFARNFIRRVRISKHDPLYDLMKNAGVPVEDENLNPQITAVFSFPMKAPEQSIVQADVTALQQLELWRIYAKHWCEHNPSATISYSDEEFLQVGKWVWDNFDDVLGLSFMPRAGGIYTQAPFEEVSPEQAAALPSPIVDFTDLTKYEHDDTTVSSHSMACSGGSCEMVDIVREK